MDLPSVWEQLQGQLYLGDARFAEVLGEKMGDKLAADADIPRLQRRKSALPLARFAAMPESTTAIVQAVRNGLLRHDGDCSDLLNPLRDGGSDCENDGQFLGNGRPDPIAFSLYKDLTAAAECGCVHIEQLRRHAGCAVNLTPNARATLITVSNRGLAPGASAL